jgi:hypothetical protein
VVANSKKDARVSNVQRPRDQAAQQNWFE